MASKSSHGVSWKKANIRLVQLNARRARRVLPEIRQKAVEEGADILMLQEPYQRNGKIEGFGIGTRIVYHNDECPWAALVILNPEISVLKISHLCNTHFAVAELSHRGITFYAVSCYFQLSHDIEKYIRHLDVILESLRGRGLLIGLDSNAKSPL